MNRLTAAVVTALFVLVGTSVEPAVGKEGKPPPTTKATVGPTTTVAPTSTTAAPTSTTVASTSTTVPGTTTTQVAPTTTTTTAPLTTTTTIAPVTQNRTVHVSPGMLAEATNPRVDISQFGSASAYYKPGPEAMAGYVLRDLRDYLQRVTGGQHPLSADPPGEAGIVVGTFAEFGEYVPPIGLDRSDPEAFAIGPQGQRFYILGSTTFGMMAAVYSFLDSLGVRWLAPGPEWENVPSRPGLALDAALAQTSSGPSYKWRGYFSTYGVNWRYHEAGVRDRQYLLWQIRNRLGGAGYVQNSHNPNVIDPALRSTRPEYFAKSADGTISQTEVNRAHPDVVTLAVDRAVAYLQENQGRGTYFDSYSVEPNDGLPCDEAGRIAAGDLANNCTNIDFDFASKVAAGVRARGLPDLIGMLSYSDHALIPARPIDPQVAVQVATDLAFFPPGQALTVEQRLTELRDRGVTGNRLGVYDYMGLIAWTFDRPGYAPAGRPLELAQSIKRWHVNGARTFTAETSDSFVNGGVGQYMATRLLWDADADAVALRDTYYRDAFGPAAASIQALAEEWAAKPELSRPNLSRWWATIDAASAAVGSNAALRARIADVKRYWLYLNLWREYNVNITDGVPSKAARWNTLLRYVAQNAGEDSMHAVGLFFTLGYNTGQPSIPEVTQAELDPVIQGMLADNYDPNAWAQFPRISDADIASRFTMATLPATGQATGTIDPQIRVVGTGTPPASIALPWLHNAGGPPVQVALNVMASTTLTLNVDATNQAGGSPEHVMVVTDPQGREVLRRRYADGITGTATLGVTPGNYMVSFPNHGTNKLTVSGGSTWGAVRAFSNRADGWGYYPFSSGPASRAYFVVPAGWDSLRVGLASGSVSVTVDGQTTTVTGSGAIKATPQVVPITPSSVPRVAYIEFGGYSVGTSLEGVTLFNVDPTGVLYETVR